MFNLNHKERAQRNKVYIWAIHLDKVGSSKYQFKSSSQLDHLKIQAVKVESPPLPTPSQSISILQVNI